ncbi:hypothetical protein SO802_008417 [Lithocarpus litseifolius]|uniref:Uncharacterized protein n=1 Tax=Lithocarpus litseifolius TaxID=425828 RepID=A0AAW2D8K3_9ROSI
MAASVSRRLLRSLGSLYTFGRCDSPSITCQSFHGSHDLSTLGYSGLFKGGPSFLANRWLSTSILTPDSGEGAFPTDLLSTKPMVTAERSIDLSTLGYSGLFKGGPSFLAKRWLSTSILTPDSGEGAFPTDLLSTKPMVGICELPFHLVSSKVIGGVGGTFEKVSIVPAYSRVLDVAKMVLL